MAGPSKGKYPPAEPGALGIGPLEAAAGSLTRPYNCWPPKGGRSAPQIHLVQMAVVLVHRQASFRVRGGSRSEVSAMDDRPKCQTFAASPAEPGVSRLC